MDYAELVKELRESVNPRENRAADAIEELSEALERTKQYAEVWESFANEVKDKYQAIVEHENPFFESLKRGLEQAINGEVREMTIKDNVR